MKKVRVRKKEKAMEEEEEMSRSLGGPVLALPLIAPRAGGDFRDVEGKLSLPSISENAEFSASNTDAPTMPPTMTVQAGFLSKAIKTDRVRQGGETVFPELVLSDQKELPLGSWSSLAKELPVDSSNDGRDISSGKTPTATGSNVLGGRGHPIPDDPNQDTVTGLHSSASTIVATSTQTTTITRRVIITTPKSASHFGSETTARSLAEGGISKGVQNGETEAGFLSGGGMEEETTPLSYFLPQGSALLDNRSSGRVDTANNNNNNDKDKGEHYKQAYIDSEKLRADDEENRIPETEQKNRHNTKYLPRNIGSLVKSARLKIDDDEKEKDSSSLEVKSSVRSNYVAPNKEVDTSGTSSLIRAKTSTQGTTTTTTTTTTITTITTTTQTAGVFQTYGKLKTPTRKALFKGKSSSTVGNLQESDNIGIGRDESFKPYPENQRKLTLINFRLSNDQSNANIENNFNEIDTDSGDKSKLGFIADNYLALRQKHKARSTTNKPRSTTSTTKTTTTTITTTTTTTTYRPPRRKTTDGQVLRKMVDILASSMIHHVVLY